MNAEHSIPDLSQHLVSETHWTSTKYSKHMLMDALVKHILSLMPYGMTDLGEVLEVVGLLRPGDEERWISTWGAMAQRLQARAEASERDGKLVSAGTAYLRASTYWRAALLNFSAPGDPRLRDYALASAHCYERSLELSGYPGEYVEIPYEDSFLPGHVHRSPVAAENSPLLIITPGRDTWAEDTRWVIDGAMKRGIHCLVYDGPGQGYALRLYDMKFRPDWENVIGPVVDFALALPGIDKSRVGMMGLSFGGFLVTRAAAFEKRVKICIMDPGNISWGQSIIGHFPGFIADALLERRGKTIQRLVSWGLERSPVGWLLKDYAWKHGVPVREVFKTLLPYDNPGIAGRIECKTLVMDGTGEIIPGKAKILYDALTCPKHYMLFDDTTTAQSHCQIGGYATGTEMLFDWIEDHL